MKEYQQRVVDEKTQLDEKIIKLDFFTNQANFAELSRNERIRLIEQLFVMRQYSNILTERIENFSE